MSHINVSDLNNSAQAKIKALEEKLNEVIRCFSVSANRISGKASRVRYPKYGIFGGSLRLLSLWMKLIA